MLLSSTKLGIPYLMGIFHEKCGSWSKEYPHPKEWFKVIKCMLACGVVLASSNYSKFIMRERKQNGWMC